MSLNIINQKKNKRDNIMAWVAVHQQIRDHRKTRDLFRTLKISRQEAIGILVLIWTWAIDNCNQDGELLSVTIDDISDAAYWNKKPEILYKALVDCKWIDEVDNKIYLHDWNDFNEPFYKFIERKEKDKDRKRKEKEGRKSIENPQKIQGNSKENQDTFQASHSPAHLPSPSPSQEQDKTGIKDKEIKQKKPKEIEIIIPPDIEDVKTYCKERGDKVDPNTWFDFYTSKGWVIGKEKMKDWKAAIRTWEHKNKEKGIKEDWRNF